MLTAVAPFLLTFVSAFHIRMLLRVLLYFLTSHPHVLRDLPPLGSLSYLSPYERVHCWPQSLPLTAQGHFFFYFKKPKNCKLYKLWRQIWL